jgi:hypothetical protein
MAETETVILKQEEGERLAHEHGGGVALYGDKGRPALAHQIEGSVLHATHPQQPLVHMVCWDADEPCRVEVSGQVVLAGDEKAPIPVVMTHRFDNAIREHMEMQVAPLDHTVNVSTGLAQPIHHALQMRTPLQVRFCNTWQVASNYTFEVRMGNRSLFSIQLTGATVATPQPCPEEEPCPPPIAHPGHP